MEMLKKEYSASTEYFQQIPGVPGLALRAFISLIHPAIGNYLYQWSEWQKTYCPNETMVSATFGTIKTAGISLDNTVTEARLLPVTLAWRAVAGWGTEDWNLARQSFLQARSQSMLNLQALWKVVRCSFRRAEIVLAIEPVLNLYTNASATLSEEQIAVMCSETEIALKGVLKAGENAQILFAEAAPEIARNSFQAPDIRRDLSLFMVYSMDNVLGNVARLPFNKLFGTAWPDQATMLREAQTFAALREEDIEALHQACLHRCQKFSLHALTNLVPLAFPESPDANNNPETRALLACMRMSFAPDRNDTEQFKADYATVRSFYNASRDALVAAAAKK